METGFPSPAQGYEDTGIDLGSTLVRHPAATYCMRMGRSYPQYGIYSGDIVIVDRSIEPKHEQLVVYTHDGCFKCGRIFFHGTSDITIFGTITFIIHSTTGSRTDEWSAL